MEPWQLISLEIDNAASDIGKYFEQNFPYPIRRMGNSYEPSLVITTDAVSQFIDSALGSDLERKLVVYGSGYYHHYTYGLCKHASKLSKEYAYIHFDHHNDYKYSGPYASKEEICYGGFISKLLKDTKSIKKAFLIGSKVSRMDAGIFAKIPEGITESELRKKGGLKKLEDHLARIPHDVYLSFDLDVMRYENILTDFSQGQLQKEELMEIISMIKQTKKIIGADILGYSRYSPNYSQILDPLMTPGILHSEIKRRQEKIGKELYKEIATSLLEA